MNEVNDGPDQISWIHYVHTGMIRRIRSDSPVSGVDTVAEPAIPAKAGGVGLGQQGEVREVIGFVSHGAVDVVGNLDRGAFHVCQHTLARGLEVLAGAAGSGFGLRHSGLHFGWDRAGG